MTEGQRVGALWLDLREVQTPVQDRYTGGEHDVRRADARPVVEVHGGRAGEGSGHDTTTGDHGATLAAYLADQGLEDVHGVELGLVAERGASEVGERHVEVVLPSDREA